MAEMTWETSDGKRWKLDYTYRLGHPGRFNPRDGGEPPEGTEVEFETATCREGTETEVIPVEAWFQRYGITDDQARRVYDAAAELAEVDAADQFDDSELLDDPDDC